ncbi:MULTISPECIES: tRNA pseudouridine(38-40) synthase TruA [Gemella]|uniref:tRNA pseudouridine(38-40) synthase TruA n=1 Tax=Gemella TaxID=1378 RepID=UPI000767F98B|nr:MULTISPECIES: tRNA pseudouridine(38-40) synthase TruA [Gemella]AME09057.1 pseudouridine synthase [Gemella sp. oral taxon 928]AXI26629.1 tRNA pseudouridine(38-40) synthase TruA [Gemella sp. ND 6198]
MRVVLLCRYDGSGYHGFQIQPNNNTVQAEIEQSLKKIHKKDVRIYMSGRTDSKVHAYGQVLHFDSDLNISGEAWKRAINANLPKDIRIVSAMLTDNDFHVRYNSIKKTYLYKLYIGKEVDPLLINYVGHQPFRFDLEKAQSTIQYFLGEHDFTSFCSKNSSVEDKVRTIYDFSIERDSLNDNIINFEITGNGFLYNMVRIIVGTIINVANGKYEAEYIEEIFKKQDRQFAGARADAQGLYLKCVEYNNEVVNRFIKNALKYYK